MYKSGHMHDVLQAEQYSLTHQAFHRFLAYRDFPAMIEQFHNIDRVVDFGSGSGASTDYLVQRGFNVVGIDKSQAMVNQARLKFPKISFFESDKFTFSPSFDLVFSSFVLFELSTKREIVNYLNAASDLLRDGGVFWGITGSEKLHQRERNWLCFNVNYQENAHPRSGDIVKLGLKDPDIEFYDYYWTESDYIECFQQSNLEIIQMHYPLGRRDESIEWKEELATPPFVIFLAKKARR